MFGLMFVDIAVIVVYFGTMIGIGIWSMRRIHNQEDYFLASRGFGKFIQTFAAFGQGTSADTAVGTATTTFTNGAAGIWSALAILWATPVYWMTSPWYRRLRLLTMGDFFQERYQSRRMAMVYAAIASIGMMSIISVGIAAVTKTTMALTPKAVEELTEKERAERVLFKELRELESQDYAQLSEAQQARLDELRHLNPQGTFSHVDEMALIAVICTVVVLYGVAGGLRAAFLTDTIQGIFIILLSLLLLPFAWARINTLYGGSGVLSAFSTLHKRLPASFLDILGSPTALDFTWYYIAALSLMVTINVVVQPNQLTAIGSAKDEFAARFGFVAGCYMKRVTTVLWGLFALFALVLYSDAVRDPDKVWGYATLDLLGPLNMGLVGLMIACLLAALMSTADCLMITASSLLTHNLYRVVHPGAGERHYVLAGRVMGILVVFGGAFIATQFTSLLALLKFLWEFYAIFAATFWLGMLWRPATRKAAWASIAAALLVFFLLPLLLPLAAPSLRSLAALTRTTTPRVIEREYHAADMDVAKREEEIAVWQRAYSQGQADGPCPERLEAGQLFTKSYSIPARAIFWTQGLETQPDGSVVGRGMLNIGLLALGAAGLDLVQHSYALNETLRILIRVVLPFVVLILVSWLTRHENEAALDRFYAKMKTPVLVDREADQQALEVSYADPHRFDDQKMFPGTGWECLKWRTVDIVGFAVSLATAFAIVGLLFGLLAIGR
jgi:SSS family solute:Na+ symporter